MCGLVSVFVTQKCCSFLKLIKRSLNISRKELTISPIIYFHKLYRHRESIVHRSIPSSRQSRMLTRPNVNNDTATPVWLLVIWFWMNYYELTLNCKLRITTRHILFQVSIWKFLQSWRGATKYKCQRHSCTPRPSLPPPPSPVFSAVLIWVIILYMVDGGYLRLKSLK